jgi:DNA-binding response OmpR family regulator
MAKILVIDDEQNLQRLVKANLAARGYQVMQAMDGETGLKLAARETPDVILLDLMLPDMSGWDLMAAIKEDPGTHDIPVVVMTALDKKSTQFKGRLAGSAGFLNKPFGIDELLNMVNTVLNSR